MLFFLDVQFWIQQQSIFCRTVIGNLGLISRCIRYVRHASFQLSHLLGNVQIISIYFINTIRWLGEGNRELSLFHIIFLILIFFTGGKINMTKEHHRENNKRRKEKDGNESLGWKEVLLRRISLGQ